MYKQVETQTVNLGSAGTQLRIGTFQKLDAQSFTGYLNNVRVSIIPQDTEASDISFMCYLTSSTTYADDGVITARALSAGGGNVNLTARRRIVENANISDGNKGQVSLFIEQSDTVLDEEARIVVEFWGNFITWVSA